MSLVDDMLEIALKLLERGYVPLRIEADSKAPKSMGWQTDTPTEDSIRRAFARPSNLGLRMGDSHKDGTCLVTVDVDYEHGEIIRCVERAIGDLSGVPIKKGRKGASYIFRLDREVKTGKINWFDREDKKKKVAAIDLLCKGSQTVIPPSIHPDTKLPYIWVNNLPIWDIDYQALPVLGPAAIDEIRGFCKNQDDPIYALNDMAWAGVGGGGNTHDTCVRAVSCMVGRKWTDEDIHDRIQRAKKEACEAAGVAYNWPESQKVIQEWIDSSRDKKFDSTSKVRIDDIPIEMINDYLYVRSIDRMYNLKRGITYGFSVFNSIHARDLPKPWASVLIHPDFRQVEQLTYSPGEPVFCREKSFDNEATLDCLNVYTAPDIEPSEGDVEPFVTLVKDFCDNDSAAYGHMLSFFAYAVQNPGARINHALVMQGDQGIGKDSIITAMQKVFGIQNCTQVTLQHVESAFNEWLFGKQLIVFQEMLATGRRNIYNKLKTYITDPVHTINTKHVSLQRIPNRSVYVFLTNYKHALSLDPSDRRMWVWHSKMKPKSASYYTKFYAWLNDRQSTGHLLQYLLDYDTSAFNPAAPPPISDAKRHLMEASASEIEQFLRRALDECSWPLGCDLVSLQHLHGAMRPFMRVSLSMLTEALDNLAPDGELEKRPRMGNTRLRLRAIRNQEKWHEASAEQLRDAYRMPLPPQSGETEGNYTVYSGAELGGQNGPGQPDY